MIRRIGRILRGSVTIVLQKVHFDDGGTRIRYIERFGKWEPEVHIDVVGSAEDFDAGIAVPIRTEMYLGTIIESTLRCRAGCSTPR